MIVGALYAVPSAIEAFNSCLSRIRARNAQLLPETLSLGRPSYSVESRPSNLG